MAQLPNAIQRVLDEGYTFQMGDYLSRGWQILQKNMGNFVAFVLVYLLIQALFAFIPIIGAIAGIIVNPALAVGPFIVADKLAHDRPTTFNDFFKGMDKFGNLLLAYILQALVIVGACVPGVVLLFMGGISFMSAEGLESAGSMFWAGVLLTLIPAVYLGVSYTLSNQFVWFYDLGAWEAMEASRKVVGKNWLSFLGFFIVLGLVALVGLIALGIGLLFAIPLIWCALYAAFAAITGRDRDDDEGLPDLADHLIIK